MVEEHGKEIRLYLLGGFTVLRGACEVSPMDWNRRVAARTLIKMLGLHPVHQLHREEVLETIWSEVDPESALNRFAKALHAARRALQPDLRARSGSSYIRLSGELLSLDMNRVWVDVDRFEALASRALSGGTREQLEEAVGAYGGELLPEDRYEDWAVPRREALSALYLRLLTSLGDRLVEEGAYARAEDVWRLALSQEPASEDIHRSLMRLAAEQGNRSQALRQYEEARKALQDALGVEPEPETEALYRAIRSGEVPVRNDVKPAANPDSDASPAPRREALLPAAIRRASSVPMVGRERVLSVLTDALTSAVAGDGQVVMVAGEVGIGKTRLLSELARIAAQNAVVLWGTSSSQEHVPPYGPFVDALEGYLVNLSSAERAAIAGRYPELTLVVPGLVAVTERGDAGSNSQLLYGQLTAQFAAFLGDLAEQRPVMVVLDDVHHSDDASLYLLQHLAAAAHDHRWFIAGTYREEEVEAGSEVFRLLRWMRRDGIDRRIHLSRLSREDAGRLVDMLLPEGQVDSRAADRLYSLSLGNPLFLKELVRAMRARESLQQIDGRWIISAVGTPQVPYRVADLVVDQLKGMKPHVQWVLGAATTIGMEFSLPMLRATMREAFPGTSAEQVLEALDHALEAGILKDEGERYVFRHPLVRAAIREALPTHRRTHLHGAVAVALERERPEDHQVLARHWTRSATPERAAPHLEQVATQARQIFANGEAVHAYQQLIPLLERDRQSVKVAGVRQLLSDVLTRLGRYQEAHAELECAAAEYQRAGNLDGYALVVARIAHIHFLQGTPNEGLRLLESLRADAAEEVTPYTWAAIALIHAQLCWANGDYEDQLEKIAAAGQMLERCPEHPDAARTAAAIEVWQGLALIALDRHEVGVPLLESVLPRLEAVGDMMNLSRACNTLAVACQERGEFERQLPYHERALDAALKVGEPTRIAFMRYRAGWHTWMLGDWPEARRQMEEALAIEENIGPTWVQPYVLYGLAMLSFLEGQWDGLEDRIARARAASTRSQATRIGWAVEGLQAELDLEVARPEMAITRLEAVLQENRLGHDDVSRLLALQARARLQLGGVEAARELGDRARAHIQDLANRPVLHEIQLTRAEVGLAEGDLKAARYAAEEALAVAREMRNPYTVARAQVVCGQVMQREEDRLGAASALIEAQDTFKRLGARLDAERVAMLLAGTVNAVAEAGTGTGAGGR